MLNSIRKWWQRYNRRMLEGLLSHDPGPQGLIDSNKLPSRFQLGEEVNASGRRGCVAGVTFANVDFHDGHGQGGKIYYTVEFPDGARKEFMSNDVNHALRLASEVT